MVSRTQPDPLLYQTDPTTLALRANVENLSKREWYAGLALQALISKYGYHTMQISESAVVAADDIMRELAETESKL